MKFILFFLTVCMLNVIIYGWSDYSDSEDEHSETESDVSEINISSSEEYDDEHEDGPEHEPEHQPEHEHEDDYEYDYDHDYKNKMKLLKSDAVSKDTLDQYRGELALGNPSDLFASNSHVFQPHEYKDFGRRFVLQYPYTGVKVNEKQKEENNLLPQQAPAKVVLDIAKKSASLQASEPVNSNEHVADSNVLRNGDYWNGVWREDVDPKSILRIKGVKKHKLSSVKAKVMPGSDLYELISKLKLISPRLLYVINKESKHFT